MSFEFPAFLKLEHQPDGSAKASFLAEVNSTLDTAQSRFKEFSGEAQRLVNQALSIGRTNSGALNLNVSGLREAARDQQNAAVAARELAKATAQAAQEAGDHSQKTRLAVAALEAYAKEQEVATAAAFSHAAAAAQVQDVLNRGASATRQISGQFLQMAQAEAAAANGAKMLEGTFRDTALAAGYVGKSAQESAAAFDLLFQAQDARSAVAAQNFFNTALGIDATTKKARESAASFEALYAAQDALALQQRRLYGDYVQMAQAEAAAAEGARLIAATYRGTAQEMGYTSKSARDSAAAFAELGHAQLRGTSVQGAVTNSVRASRVAYVQLGQQMQDVVIQAQLGTNAMQIFTQQVPQAAFALSGLGGKVGAVARFFSGPWGAAIFAATAVLGPLIYKMIATGDAADDAKPKTFDFSRSLDVLTLSAKDATAAMGQLADKIQSAIAVQGDFLRNQSAIAEQSVTALEQRLAGLQQHLAELRRGGKLSFIPSIGALSAGDIGSTQQQIADTQAELEGARRAKIAAAIAVSQQKVNESLDAGTKATDDYNRAVGDLNKRLEESLNDPVGASSAGRFITQSEYEKQFKRLTEIKNAALDAAKAVKKGVSDSALASIGDMTALVEQLFHGARITATTNHSKYTSSGNISDHFKGRAIDFVVPGMTDAAHFDTVRQTLIDAGVDIRRNARGTEQFFGPGHGPNGPGDTSHDNHFHLAWQGAAPDPEKVKEAFAKAQKALQDYSDRAGENIARINERFDKQPRLIDQAAAATRQLDAVIADLQEKKPPNFQTLIAQAEEAKATIQDALVRPFQEMARDSERRQQIDDLILAGQDEQAQALQEIWRLESQIGDLLPEQRAEVERIVKAEYEHGKALERAHEMQSAFLDATRSVRDEIERIIAGEGKFSDFKNIFKQLNAKFLTEKIFGGALRDLDQWVKENTGIKDSVDYLREQTHDAGEAALKFADTLNQATNRVATGGTGGLLGGSSSVAASTPADLASLFDSILPPLTGKAVPGVPGTGPAANDNHPIDVIGAKLDRSVNGLTPQQYFAQTSYTVVRPITDALSNLLGPKFGGAIGGALSGALYGYSTGGAVGGVLGAAGGLVDDLRFSVKGLGGLSDTLNKGVAGAQTGTLVAGLGKAFGLKLSSTGAQIGGAIGSMLPIPGGEIIGSIAGGIIGKLFGGTKSGRVTLNGTSQTIGGTDKKLQAAAGQTGSDFVSTLQSVAQQLGGQLGSYGTITIGQRNGSFRVNVGGSGTGSLKTSHGARDFGEDQQAAIAYALQQAIVNGAVKGISAGAQRLLAAGTDLQAQLQKALDFQGVFTELKSYLDPVGAALDTLDARFSHLKDIFAEAGASAEDYAKLQQLYGIERTKAVADAMNQVGGALKSLLSDLTTGDMGLSLRDREKTAQANYDALATRVRAGDTTAFDDFAEAARTLLDIERQIHGSQSDYFATFDNVRDLTRTTLDAQQALADAAANRDSPFAGSASGAPTNDNQGVIDGIDRLGDTLINALGPRLDAVNTNLGALIGNQVSPTDRNPLATKFAGFW